VSCDDFAKLVRNDIYQVFLFSCPAVLPISIFAHPWFVCNKKGEISRWEIFLRKNRCETSWGHLHLTSLPSLMGVETIPFCTKYHWKGRLVGYIEGSEDSTAEKMIDFIENSKTEYPYCYEYSSPLPLSTYNQS